MNQEFMTFKIINGISLAIGAGLMLFDHYFWGAGVALLGIVLGGLFDSDFNDMGCSHEEYSSKEKKPYYKDEFEEYQHYKFCKRHRR